MAKNSAVKRYDVHENDLCLVQYVLKLQGSDQVAVEEGVDSEIGFLGLEDTALGQVQKDLFAFLAGKTEDPGMIVDGQGFMLNDGSQGEPVVHGKLG